ncbi:hypothetical protein Bbelb_250390 [Branchiostoma belcheri]|nr:hypothetical protein Bbelb_250390 [Branchiostoma belcheri]
MFGHVRDLTRVDVQAREIRGAWYRLREPQYYPVPAHLHVNAHSALSFTAEQLSAVEAGSHFGSPRSYKYACSRTIRSFGCRAAVQSGHTSSSETWKPHADVTGESSTALADSDSERELPVSKASPVFVRRKRSVSIGAQPRTCLCQFPSAAHPDTRHHM